jgi:hypothetical protein
MNEFELIMAQIDKTPFQARVGQWVTYKATQKSKRDRVSDKGVQLSSRVGKR